MSERNDEVRPYMNKSADELESLSETDPRGVLAELQHRTTRKARRLRARLEGDERAEEQEDIERREPDKKPARFNQALAIVIPGVPGVRKGSKRARIENIYEGKLHKVRLEWARRKAAESGCELLILSVGHGLCRMGTMVSGDSTKPFAKVTKAEFVKLRDQVAERLEELFPDIPEGAFIRVAGSNRQAQLISEACDTIPGPPDIAVKHFDVHPARAIRVFEGESRRPIDTEKMVACPDCGSSGPASVKRRVCQTCHGFGMVPSVWANPKKQVNGARRKLE
jgi:hypothetical protein